MINLVSLSDFDNFMNGSIKERIARGISEIAQNILDPNTEAERPRTLTVTMTIRPTKNRHSAVIRSQVTTKLANLVEMEADVSGFTYIYEVFAEMLPIGRTNFYERKNSFLKRIVEILESADF